jgi:hypothetical protein
MAEVGGRYRPKSRITQGRPPDKYSSRDCRDVNLPTSCACLNEERPSHLGFLERSVRWILLRAQVVGILSSGDTCTQLWIAFSIFQPLLSLQINCNHHHGLPTQAAHASSAITGARLSASFGERRCGLHNSGRCSDSAIRLVSRTV